MATQAWAINASHSNHQLRSMQGNSSRVWVVELVVYAWCFCDSQLALSRGHPTHSIDLSEISSMHAANTFNSWVVFVSCGPFHTNAKVYSSPYTYTLPFRLHEIFECTYLQFIISKHIYMHTYIHTFTRVCNAVPLVRSGSPPNKHV